MTLTSDIVRCSYCDKSIEYHNSRISRSIGYLVCRDCRITPSVSEAPTDSSHYQEIFAEFESARLFDSPNASDYLHSPSEESLYEQNVQEFDQLSNPIPIIERARKSAGLITPTGLSPRKEVGLFTPTPTSSSIHLSAQRQSPGPIGSVSLEQALAEFDLDEYHTSDTITLLPNALMSQDKHSMRINRHMKPMLAANPRSEPEHWIDRYVNSRLQDRKGKSFLCLFCHCHFNSFSALNAHKLSHRPINLKPSTSINSGASTSFHESIGSQQSHEPADQVTPIKEKSSIKTKILASTKTPRSRGVMIFRGGRSIRVPKNDPANQFDCDYEWCDVTFASIDQLWKHIDIAEHDEQKRKVFYKCDICEKTFARMIYLKTHQLFHSDKKPYQCNFCENQFIRTCDLKRHILTHTGDKPHQCTICEKQFDRLSNLNRHKLIHTNDKLHQCDICQAQFAWSSNLNEHRRIHTGERPYKCAICKKQFVRSSNLNEHRRIHIAERTHRCNICEKQFAHSRHLSVHRRIHTGERPYQCNICEKRFITTGDLTKHRRIHTGERPYQCNICHKRFTQWASFNTHRRTHTGEKPHQCDICDKRFNSTGDLTKHRRIHTGEKPYECHICHKRFTQWGNLNAHRRIHASKKPHI